jgi:hypothetical protein
MRPLVLFGALGKNPHAGFAMYALEVLDEGFFDLALRFGA